MCGLRSRGFTIVELLIVIVVIAVLAAITTVAFRSVRERAIDSSMRSDLSAVAKLMELDKAQSGADTYATSLPSGTKTSNGTIVQLTSVSDATTFCVNAYGPSNKTMSYHSRAGVKLYLCDGATIGSAVGGTVPNAPTNTNLVADFSAWTMSGAMTYSSSTGEITCGAGTGSAMSPLVRVDGAVNTRIEYEFYPIAASPNFSPNGGVLTNSSYFASNGTTPAQSSSTPSYTGNGNAQQGPLNGWTSYGWTIQTGAAVIYVRYRVQCSPTDYTAAGLRVRNPRIMAL